MKRDFSLTSRLASGGMTGAKGVKATVRGAAGTGAEDRRYMVDLLVRMAGPVLGAMSEGRLQSEFVPELSPAWRDRDPRVGYLECLGRLMAGIAPWLALPGDDSAEGRARALLGREALDSLAHAVDPKSPDCLVWRGEAQPLVDSAYLTNAFLRARRQLWEPLDRATKVRLIAAIKGLRGVSPPYTNWLLFAAMNEAFLLSIGEDWDPMRVDLAIRKVNEWYAGDGWYADGPAFHFDHYGGYVIHTMLVEILEVLAAAGVTFSGQSVPPLLDQAYRRMQRYGEHLERMIGPEGGFAPVGRSIVYRTAGFQPLGLLAWRKRLPPSLPEGQVRAATLAAQRAVFRFPANFDAKGFLTLGFTGHQPALADWYSNAGSTYLAAVSLVALGLPADDSYWTAPGLPWTSKRAFAGEMFPKDYYVHY